MVVVYGLHKKPTTAEFAVWIGLATVYRVLTQFEAAGLVTRHNFEGGHSIFELDQGEHHDHMVCVDTGEVIEFVSEDIERLQHEIAERYGFELLDHSLVLYVQKQGAGDTEPEES